MSDHEPLERLRRANPVPRGSAPPEGLADAILAGDAAPAPPQRSAGRRRWPAPLVAGSAMLVVLLALGGLALIIDRSPDETAQQVAAPGSTAASLPPATQTEPVSAATSLQPSTQPQPGGDLVAIPDVVGLSPAAADGMLSALGFHVDRVSEPVDRPEQVGVVVSVEPEPGTEIPPGDLVVVGVGQPWAVVQGGDPPWAGAPLDAGEVSGVLATEWGGAENRGWCSALAPADATGFAPDATPRAANFGGGWATAWDRPEGPGTSGSGHPCVNCGRSAFGVAGTGLPAAGPESAQRWPTVIEYADGSVVGYGNDGLSADASDVDPETGEPVPPKKLAYVWVAGQGCLYNVWSRLGEDHLLELVDRLRFVTGMQVGTLDLWLPGEPQEVTAAGPPPWATAAPLDLTSLAPRLAGQLGGVELDQCPLLALDNLGDEAAGAAIRDANVGDTGVGVAWDNPDGPGRTGQGWYCVKCGRGAVGFGLHAETRYERGAAARPPRHRIEWEDGSVAEWGWEISSDDLLPAGAVRYTDPLTGEDALPPRTAHVVPAGAACSYEVFTFLGEDHLMYLLDQLRVVADL